MARLLSSRWLSIGLDPAQLTGVLRGIAGLKFGPVLYGKDEQVARIRAVVGDQLSTFRSLRSDPNWMEESYSPEMRLYLALAVGETLIFCKSEAFREEAEWRIAKYDFGDGRGLQFRERLGLLTPFQTIQLAPEGSRLPLHRIFVSPLGEPELAAHAATLCLNAHEYPQADALIERPTYGLRF